MSERAQREFLWLTRSQLLLVLIAAIAGVVTLKAGKNDTPVGAAVGLVAFLVSILLRIFMLARHPESHWYEGRAAAESVKTLAWRYAVGGHPFPVSGTNAEELFVSRVNDVLSSLSNLDTSRASASQLTSGMKKLRSEQLAERKAVYEHERIEDQQSWYAEKAEWNRRRATAWGLMVLGVQTFGALAAIAYLADWVGVSLLGVAASAAAGATAWLQTRQHESLTTAYSVASQELATIRSLIDTKDDNDSWASFVEDAEEAISREHTMWRASRGLRKSRW
jgi:hypothetical protein